MAKHKAYDELYERLDTKGEKVLYHLVVKGDPAGGMVYSTLGRWKCTKK